MPQLEPRGARTTRELDEALANRGRQMLHGLQGGLVSESGGAYLDWLVEYLREASGQRSVLVGQVEGVANDRIVSIALSGSGDAASLSYELAGTPCSDVLRDDICLVPGAASTRYPMDRLLVSMGIESYVGVALRDGSKHNIGLIAILGTEAVGLDQARQDVALLKAFRPRTEAVLIDRRARISSEMQRRELEIRGWEAERRALQLQRTEGLGKMALGISHDINNLLTVILGSAELARNHSSGDPVISENLERVIIASTLAAEICSQVLSYAKNAKGGVELFELGSRLRGWSPMLRGAIPERVNGFETVGA